MHIHKPKPLHGAREFLGEISVIVIGILIAIGLEQAVELFHHGSQRQEARGELTAELRENVRSLNKNLKNAAWAGEQLKADLERVRHVSALEAPSPTGARLDGVPFYWPEDGAWQSAKQSGVTILFPHPELKKYTYVYDGIAEVKIAELDYARQAHLTQALIDQWPGGRHDAEDLRALSASIAESQAKLSYLRLLFSLEGVGLKRALGHGA